MKIKLDVVNSLIEEGKTQKEIAQFIGVTPAAVCYFFAKNNIRTKRNKNTDPNKSQRNKRILVLKLMGGKCVKCGFNDPRALQVDHVYGGGKKESKSIGVYGIHKKIIKNPSLINTEYQLLCANCNWIKRSENKEVRKYH